MWRWRRLDKHRTERWAAEVMSVRYGLPGLDSISKLKPKITARPAVRAQELLGVRCRAR